MKKIIKILMAVLLIFCSTGMLKNNVRAEDAPDLPKIDVEASVEKVVVEKKYSHKTAPSADPDATALVGEAYVIFTDGGEMIFFRSEETLLDETEQTVTINGKSYSGTVFAGIEEVDFGYYDPTWADYNMGVTTAYVAAGHTIRPISIAEWFAYSGMTSFDATGFDLSECYDMQYLFYQCPYIEELDLRAFDTSAVEDMSGVFLACMSLTDLDISTWDTSNVIYMMQMFQACYFLSELDLSNFETPNLMDMYQTFGYDYALTTLDVSNFDTSNVSDMSYMFYDDDNLYQIKLGKKWTNWVDEAYLPEGNWRLIGKNIVKTETGLYNEYGSNAEAWAGVWSRREVVRLAGTDRIDTAIKTAVEIKNILGVDKLDAVVLAYAWNFPDALGGSYLAAMAEAPILLIDKGSASKVSAFIKENLADDGLICVLGGEAVVQEAWLAELSGYEIIRLAGEDRFLTNLAILNEVGVDDNDPILVCSGWTFADSLSAGATGLPLLLVSTKLTAEQKEFLAAHADNGIIIVGGESAVSAAVEAEINEYAPVLGRIAGNDRYETSVIMADAAFYKPAQAVLAYAWNFPDGLSSGPLAYFLGAPILLVDKSNYALAQEYCENPWFIYDGDLYIGSVTSFGYIMGGSGLVTDKAAVNVFGLYSSEEIVVK